MTGRGRALLPALGLAVAVGLLGCGRGSSEKPAEPLMDVFRKAAQEGGLTRTQTEGKRLFATDCATCHGDNGGGDGQNAYNLDPQPPDFGTSLSGHPKAYWRQIIEGGTASVSRSPLCPPWGRSLSSAQIDALVAYLETLARPPAPAKAAEASTPKS
jgi:mono/diheme cytochrome c family protein